MLRFPGQGGTTWGRDKGRSNERTVLCTNSDREVARRTAKWHLAAMSIESLEKEVTTLKRRVEKLEGRAPANARRRWLNAVGSLKDCDLLDEALRLGRQIREQAGENGR